jgi:hypothetical protein
VFREEVHNISQTLGACKATAEQWRFRFKKKKKKKKHIPEKWCHFFEMARQQ